MSQVIERRPGVPPTTAPGHLPYIDGLRGLAILGVLVVHVAQFVQWQSGPLHTALLREFTGAGARGVQLFFMISAFTLYASTRRRRRSEPRPRVAFYVRRAFRILPPWWVAVALFSWRRDSSPWPQAFMYFGLIRFKPAVEPFNLGWSIFVEESFYLVFPFLLAYIQDLEDALLFTLVSVAVAFAWSTFAPQLGVPTANSFVDLFPLNQWFCFGAGFALYHALPLKAPARDSRWTMILDAAAAISVLVLIRGSHFAATATLALVFVAASVPGSFFSSLAEWRPLGALGRACYSTYLFHLIVIEAVGPTLPVIYRALHVTRASPDVLLLIAGPLLILLSGALGYLSWQLLERPSIALGRAVLGRLPARPLPLQEVAS